MSYSDFGLDVTKKAKDDSVLVKEFLCPWCNNGKVNTGFNMCFSNFVICPTCLSDSKDEKRWSEADYCFKCKKTIETGFSSFKENGTILYLCKDCIDWGKQVLFKQTNINMNFFEQLASLGNVDLSIRIYQKGDKLTLNIMPGVGNAGIKPILVTGTPSELDAEFFTAIAPTVSEISGLVTNISEVKKEAEEKAAPKASAKKDDKKPASKAKPEKVAAAATAEPDLFGDDEEEETKEEE